MAERKPTYIVIFDTNIFLQHFDGVVSLIEAFQKNKAVELIFYAPDIVVGEYRYNLHNKTMLAHSRFKNAAKELSKLIGLEIQKVNIDKKDVYKIAEEKLINLGIETLEVPYEKINFKEITAKAIEHELPFQIEGDKGFKDAVVAETIKYYLPELTQKGKVVFICNDDKLRDYTAIYEEKFKDYKTYQSPPDFETELKLQLLKLGDQLINVITKEAEKAFYSPGDKKSLFFTEDLKKRIHEGFPTLFSNPEFQQPDPYLASTMFASLPEKCAPYEEPTYATSAPYFLRKDTEDIYVWNSVVTYSQTYECTPASYINTSIAGYSKSQKLHYLEFDIEWKSKVDNNCKIIDAEIINVKYRKPVERSWLMMPEYSFPTPMSNVTLAGQGTIPVTSSIEKSLSYSIKNEDNNEKEENE